MKDFTRIVFGRLGIILVVAILVAGIALGISLLQTPQYQASVNLLVGQESGIVDNPGNAQGLRDLTQTMAQAVRTRSVAEEVIRRQGLSITPEEFLGDRLSATQLTNTQFIQVDYRDPDPRTARAVADEVGEVFTKRISDVSPGASAVTATVWERAAVPEVPVSPNPLRNAVAGLVLGAMLGVGLAFLLEYLDDRWRSPEEAEQVSGVPTFGVVPRFEVTKGKKKAKGKKTDGEKGKDRDGSYPPEGQASPTAEG